MAQTFTTLYALSKYAAGDTGWDSTIDANFDTTENEIARARIPFLSPTVGATTTIDLSQTVGARFFAFTVSQATTIAFTNVPTSAWAVRIRLLITNGAAFVVSWPASVSWLGGVAPALKASGVDEVELRTKDGGVTWYAELQADRRFQLGTSTLSAKPTLAILTNGGQSTASTSDTSLLSVTVRANTLAANGDQLVMTFMLRATTQNCSFNVKFGATASTALTITAGTAVLVQAVLIRTGASAQRLGLAQGAQVTPAENLGTDIGLDLRGSATSGGTLTLDSAAVLLVSA
jgi:hypothetical protein